MEMQLRLFHSKEEEEEGRCVAVHERRVNKGDIWVLGSHLLACRDATKEEDRKFLQQLNIGCVYTDPPYGIGLHTGLMSCEYRKKHKNRYLDLGWDKESPPKETFDYLLSLDVPTVIWGGII